MEQEAESKLVYTDSDGKTRAIRGRVSVSDGLVTVERSNGHLIVPLHRVLLIEKWNGGDRP
jgi:hypothetical protein